MKFRRSLRAKCPRCLKYYSRFFDLRRHAIAMHGVPIEGISIFLREARKLALRRKRIRLLKKRFPARGARNGTFFSMLHEKAALACNSQGSVKTDREVTSSGFVVRQITRASDTKRLRKRDIAHSGFQSDFKELCPTATCFQIVLERTREASAATARQWAGLFNRFLYYATDNFKDKTHLEALLSVEIANSYVEKYAKFFANQSTINAIVSVIKALTLMRYNENFKKAMGLKPGMEVKLNRVIDHWAHIKRAFVRKSRNSQREMKSKKGIMDWTHTFPIMLALEYLAQARQAFLKDFDTHRGEVTVQDTIVALRSTCSLIMLFSGCRQVVALRLTPANLAAATQWDGFFIIRVNSHKTARFYGCAHIILRPFQYKLFVLLAERVKDTRSIFGVPETHGTVAEILFKDFNDYVEERTGRKFVMRFNNARKVAETFSYILQGLPQNRKGTAATDVVTSFLMHTRATRDLYYHSLTDGEILANCRTYQSVFATLAALEMIREKQIYVPGTENGKICNLPYYWSDANIGVIIPFFCLFAGKLPSKEHLYKAVQEQYGYLDLLLPETCPYALYRGIVQLWKVVHRSALIDCLAKKATALRRRDGLSIKDAIQRATDSLQPPWTDTDEALHHEVFEKITLSLEEAEI